MWWVSFLWWSTKLKVSAIQGAGRSLVCSCEPHADGINIFMACAYKKKKCDI